MNYRQEQVLTSSGDYNEDEKLNRQVVDPGIDLKVHPSHIRMELPETIDARDTPAGIGMPHHQHAAC
jgi:conjugal transfer ATP-binding protein TraC